MTNGSCGDILAPFKTPCPKEGDQMTSKEGVPQELRNCKPEDFEIMAGLVYAIGESFPINGQKLTEGLKAAVTKAPFLGVFIDEGTESLTEIAQSALGTLETMGFIARTDTNWIVSDSGDPQNNPKNQLNNRVESVFNQQGRAVLKEAAEAAKQVWAVQETK